MRYAHRVWLGLGSNMGDRQGWLEFGLEQLAACKDVRIEKVSSIYLTAPWGVEEQEDYLNAAAGINTCLAPFELLELIQDIELRSGRQRPYRWAPRPLDIDILLFDDMISDDERLTLPHSRMKQRLFVLLPLWEAAGDIILPDGSALAELVEEAKKDQQAQIYLPADQWQKGQEVCK